MGTPMGVLDQLGRLPDVVVVAREAGMQEHLLSAQRRDTPGRMTHRSESRANGVLRHHNEFVLTEEHHSVHLGKDASDAQKDRQSRRQTFSNAPHKAGPKLPGRRRVASAGPRRNENVS